MSMITSLADIEGAALFFGPVIMISGLVLLWLYGHLRRHGIAIASVVCIVIGSIVSWESGLEQREGTAITAMIVTPKDGENAGLCPIVRGIAPMGKSDEAYWLAAQEERAEKPYLIARVSPNPTTKIPLWDNGHTGLGRFDQVGQRFYLLLLHTTGGRTLDVASYVHQEFPLHDDIEVSHKVLVTQTAEPGCPGSS
ncbi:hypothetical protein [Micromonospora sp. CPCC 206061]|uniref:hypothetical protein n=1 Tax=Micromonospora sp. CPCC 206061 TaxID=3122410 RepID=UPI002FEFC6D1